MSRRMGIALILSVCLLPALASASYRFGVGIHGDGISGGLEFRIWAPVGENSSLFIAPHGFGMYYFSDNDEADNGGEGFCSVGLRIGVMRLPDNWSSLFFGIGGGYTYDSWWYGSQSRDFGGRLFAGISVAPFDIISQEIDLLEWTKALKGLRVEINSGFQYRNYYRRYREWIGFDDDNGEYIYEWKKESGHYFALPDIGAGISFNW